jgi:hypothetical protein
MANEIQIVVTSDDRSDPGLNSAKAKSKATADSVVADQKRIGDASDKTASQVTGDFKQEGAAGGDFEKLIGEATKGAETSLDGLGAKSDETSAKVKSGLGESGKAASDFDRLLKSSLQDDETALQTAAKAVDDMKQKVIDLKREFGTSGNVSVLGDLKSAQSDLKALEGLLDSMVVKAKDEGTKIGDDFKNGITDGVQEAGVEMPGLISPESALIAAGLAGPVAVLLGAAIADAITTGVGFGLVGAAAYIQKDNPAITSAFSGLKDEAVSVFTDASDVMVKPFADGLSKIGDEVEQESGKFKAAFAAAAPAVGPLVGDLDNLLTAIMPGVIADAKVFANVLSDPSVQRNVALMEATFGELFTDIGNNQRTVSDFFTFLLATVTIVEGALDALVKTAGVADDAMHFLFTLATGVGGGAKQVGELGIKSDTASTSVTKLGTAVQATGGEVGYTTTQLSAMSTQLNATTVNANTLGGQLVDKLLGSLMNSQLAVLHFDESLTTLTTTLKSNKDALNIHTTAGQADREAVLAAVEANIKMYDSQIAAGASTAQAAAAYDKNTAALEKTLQQAGLTKAQIDGLIGSYKNVPDTVNTDILLGNLTDAINDLDRMLALINNITDPKSVDITINELVKQSNVAALKTATSTKSGGAGQSHDLPTPAPAKSTSTGGTQKAYAHGGILGSGPNIVGEDGWELIDSPGATVRSHADSVSSAQSGGGGFVELRLPPLTNTVLDQLFLVPIRKLVRTLGPEAVLGIKI